MHPVSWELMGEGRKLADKLGVDLAAVVLGARNEATQAVVRRKLRLWRRSRLSRRGRHPHGLPQRALHQGADRSRQHLQAGNPAAGRDDARPRSRRLGRDDAADRPHRRLHRARRRRGRLARRDASDLRRLAALHDLHAELPAANGDRAPARDADAGARRKAARPRRRTSARPGGRRHRHQGAVLSARPRIRQSPISPMPMSSSPAASASARRKTSSWSASSPSVLGAEFGGSRPLVQKGWISSDRQIGQTGKTIRPEALYRRRHFRRDPAPRRRRGRGSASSRSTPTRMRRSSISPMSASSPTRSGCCRRSPKPSASDCRRISATG